MAASLHALGGRLPSNPITLWNKVDAISKRLRLRLWLLTRRREMSLREMSLYPKPGGGLPFSKGTTTTSLVVLMAEPHSDCCLPTGLRARSRQESHLLDPITQAALDLG
ncbi:hypothetical protein GE21DRAFT_1306220 [Neurospora crassa]|nr:hypothetical protein B13N20.40 [imported] - Neurospora crassa [Neurospora crassa]KHE87137.1 hypothetical protein GE21DRAFT_1306220 [Neurospora crassa]